ncbi:MAG: hypothetical protein HUU37_06920, partial [Bdellovibrionales bacterium]|nr:hypothetical protein [Bdellovibrionales bacterium]
MRLFWKRADFPMAHLVDHPGFLADRSAIWARLRAGGEAAPLGFAWRGGALWLVREWLPGRTAGKATAPRFLSACERLARWESEGILHGDL